jgi:hypothetical protein
MPSDLGLVLRSHSQSFLESVMSNWVPPDLELVLRSQSFLESMDVKLGASWPWDCLEVTVIPWVNVHQTGCPLTLTVYWGHSHSWVNGYQTGCPWPWPYTKVTVIPESMDIKLGASWPWPYTEVTVIPWVDGYQTGCLLPLALYWGYSHSWVDGYQTGCLLILALFCGYSHSWVNGYQTGCLLTLALYWGYSPSLSRWISNWVPPDLGLLLRLQSFLESMDIKLSASWSWPCSEVTVIPWVNEYQTGCLLILALFWGHSHSWVNGYQTGCPLTLAYCGDSHSCSPQMPNMGAPWPWPYTDVTVIPFVHGPL